MAEEATNNQNSTPEVKSPVVPANATPPDGSANIPPKPVVNSGLNRSIKRMLDSNFPEPNNGGGTNGNNGNKNAETGTEKQPAPIKKGGYGNYKNIGEADVAKITALDEDGLRNHAIMREDDYRKWQKVAEERKVALDNLKASIDDGTATNAQIAKYKEFVENLRKDPAGALKKYREDFDLPDEQSFGKQIIDGDVNTRLGQWQKAELIPEIEKKYKLEAGDFVFDPADAYKAGTPSYEYRVKTEQHETQMLAEHEERKKRDENILAKIIEERDKDMQYLVREYFDGNENDLKEKLLELDSMSARIKEGDVSSETNPFSLRNVFRGVYFDELLSAAVKRQSDAIHAQYRKYGMFLPAQEKVPPTDVTKVKGVAPVMPADAKVLDRSPLRRSLQKYNK